MCAVALHEIMHSCFGSFSEDLKEHIGIKNNREELLIGFLEPILFDLLNRKFDRAEGVF
jgi:hypothetical protein